MNPGESPLLEVADLRIELEGERRVQTLVSDVSLTVRAGEAVGIVGESGSGKSLTARAVVSLLPPGIRATGAVSFKGQVVTTMSETSLRGIRGSGIGLLPQDPFTMLNPLRRCGQQVAEGFKDLSSMSRGEVMKEVERRLREVGIADPSIADRYPFQLSGGLRQRVGIAAALAPDPELLIADEPSTALDVTTQDQILRLLRTMQDARALAVILITHDLRVAFSMCDRIYVLYAGEVLEAGNTGSVRDSPLHPYSLGLLMAEPPVDRRLEKLTPIPGTVPSPDSVLDRCAFSDRCRWAAPVCLEAHPRFRAVAGGRGTRCVRTETISEDLRLAKLATLKTSDNVAEAHGEPIVRIEALDKTFRGLGRARTNLTAVDGVSLTVSAGESVGLVGESGSGKTTLSRCALGLDIIDGGSIEVDGVCLTPAKRPTRAQRRTLSRAAQIIFQDPYTSLNPARSVGATLAEAAALGGELETETVPGLLAQVGLPRAFANRRPGALSGGERQRVAIGRALAVRPKIIICDEPVSALDVSVQAQILNLLNDLRRDLDLALLFITHDLGVVRQITSRIYVMRQGKIVEDGPTETVLDHPAHPYTRSLIASIPKG